jgi:hypothetical protein
MSWETHHDPSNIAHIMPAMAPHLGEEGFEILLRYNVDTNREATKALYRRNVIHIDSEPGKAVPLLLGLKDTPDTNKKWISKMEAFLSTEKIVLDTPNFTITNRLLDVRFALKEVVITERFLLDLEIQAHSKRAKERERARERRRERGEDAPEVEYTDFYDHAVDYDFADAQIVRHLVSQSQNVTLHAPLASIQYPDLTRPLGYYEAVARPLGLLRYIKRDRRNDCEWVDWPKYLATAPYLSQFAPKVAPAW